ncbi:MAG: nucleoside deaminase [Chlorobiaceae bacterium]|nr:nucleoside deaminase [Chlorobiaceae bacterium]
MLVCNTRQLLPDPLKAFLAILPETISEETERMLTVIELSRLNVLHGTGGPFGAAVFETATGRLISAGVNVVVESRCSHAHAEMIALAAAEQQLQTFDLSTHKPELELVTSAEPCAMCFGAIIWSGIRKILSGATGRDAEEAGFDEGPKPADWKKCLERRGICVTTELCRNEARAVLTSYRDAGGIIYNPQRKG